MYRIKVKVGPDYQFHNSKTRETAGCYICKEINRFFKNNKVNYAECGSEEDGINSESYFIAGGDRCLNIKVEVTGGDILETSIKQKLMGNTEPHLAGLADYQHYQWKGEEECKKFHKMVSC